MTYVLTTLTEDWPVLRRRTPATWLWLDMVPPGLHLGDSLPEDMPAQLSHVWGWGPGWWVRVRADRDLPGGMVGALLTQTEQSGSEPTPSVAIHELQTWGTDDPAVSLADPYPLPRKMRRLVATFPRLGHSGQVGLATLDFVDG